MPLGGLGAAALRMLRALRCCRGAELLRSEGHRADAGEQVQHWQRALTQPHNGCFLLSGASASVSRYIILQGALLSSQATVHSQFSEAAAAVVVICCMCVTSGDLTFQRAGRPGSSSPGSQQPPQRMLAVWSYCRQHTHPKAPAVQGCTWSYANHLAKLALSREERPCLHAVEE